MSNEQKVIEPPEVESFWVDNPEWTYSRKKVCLASDVERTVRKLFDENALLREHLKTAQERCDEWEKAARLAKQQRNLMRVVK